MVYLSGFKTELKSLFRITFYCILYWTTLIHGFAQAQVIPVILPESAYIFQEVLVRYQPQTTYAEVMNIYTTLKLKEIAYSPYNNTIRLRIPFNVSVPEVATILNQHSVVAFAEPNYLRTINFIPNDPLFCYQWHLNNPNIEQTWDLSLGTNVVVAILDTGIAYRNGDGYAQAPDLKETIFMPGYDFVNDDPYPDDDNRHGTHIAGIIAQSTNNLYGGAGIAPGCTIMPIKVLDETGFGDVADIVDGIYFAVNNGAHIINMSLGAARINRGRRNNRSTSEEEAINYAVSQGVTVICSAGNEASNVENYPASYEATISVTASKYDQSFASSYSSYGPNVDICAPGGDINEDINGDGYSDGIYQQTHDGIDYMAFDFYSAEGTSASAAFVSGVSALILAAAGKPLTPMDVREILQTTAIDLGDPGWDQFYGWGLVNPLAAVQASMIYAAESHFLPSLLYNGIQLLSAPSNILINPINLPINTTNQNSYHTNAGFAPLTPRITLNEQAFPPQVRISSQTQNYIWPELLTDGLLLYPLIWRLLFDPYIFLQNNS
ncbi:MAG: S8 family peptidase [bacterium]